MSRFFATFNFAIEIANLGRREELQLEGFDVCAIILDFSAIISTFADFFCTGCFVIGGQMEMEVCSQKEEVVNCAGVEVAFHGVLDEDPLRSL